MTRGILPVAIVISVSAALTAWPQKEHPTVLWAGTAVEHDGAALQAFGLARSLLDQALRAVTDGAVERT